MDRQRGAVGPLGDGGRTIARRAVTELWPAFNARPPDATQQQTLRTLAALPELAPEWRQTLDTICAKRAR